MWPLFYSYDLFYALHYNFLTEESSVLFVGGGYVLCRETMSFKISRALFFSGQEFSQISDPGFFREKLVEEYGRGIIVRCEGESSYTLPLKFFLAKGK